MDLRLLLSLGWVAGSLSYPELWASLRISFLQSLSPGDKFGHMSIRAFENQTGLACVIASNVPKEGFSPSTDYNITVSSSLEGGVGHLIVASSGQFYTLQHGLQTATFTDRSERQSHVTWVWRSPAADEVAAVVVGLYAVCATAFGGQAYVATSLDLTWEGAPAKPCSMGESNPDTMACLCSSRFPGATVCPAGLCCRSHGVCSECKSRIVPNWSLWLGLGLLLLVLSLGVFAVFGCHQRLRTVCIRICAVFGCHRRFG